MIAFLLCNPVEAGIAAGAFGVGLQYLDVLNVSDIENAFRTVSKGRAEGVLEIVSGFIRRVQQKAIAALAIESRLPVNATAAEVEARGLMSYGVNRDDLLRRAATYVDKILKGAKPADLPIEQPIKVDLVINLKTAKQLRITIPPEVLYRVDKVIE